MSAFASRFPVADQSPGLMLWRVTNSWQREIRAALRPHGLTHVQFVLLAALAAAQPSSLTQRELSESAATDPMMTSQVVRALEKKGLVDRVPHASDKRAVLLTPTAAGMTLAVAAVATVEATDSAFFAALPVGHVARFTADLMSLHARATAADG